MRDPLPTVSARILRNTRVWFFVFSAAAAAAACSQSSADGAATGTSGPTAVVVTTAPVIVKPMAVETRAVGNVEASSSVDVRSQVSGELLTVGFTEGQEVTAGQVLFRINPRQFEVTLQQAEAQLSRTMAQRKGMAAQAQRAQDLLQRGLLSRSEYEPLMTQLAVYDASIEADRAQVENARLQLQYTTIAAPVSGRTGALLVHPGSLVRANDPTPLVVINQVSPAFVSFAVPARLLPQLRRDHSQGALRVLAAPAGSRDVSVAGSLSFIDNAVDPATDTIRLKATFSNRDRSLWAGAFVDVTLLLSIDAQATVVPNAAVQVGQQGQYVYVVKADETVELRPITVGWTSGDDVVVQQGVTSGETVVTDGQLRLTPGARVSVVSATRTAS